MRENIEGAEIRDSMFGKGNRRVASIQTLAGTFTMTAGMPQLLFLDPGGASRTVLLPPEVIGDNMVVVNTADAAENLTFKDDSNTNTILVVGQAETGFLFCNGTAWIGTTGVA